MPKEYSNVQGSEVTQQKSSNQSLQFKDNRQKSSLIKQLQMDDEGELAQLQADEKEELGQMVAQRQPNKTGLPDNLKSGMENLSGISLDGVKVHYNSPKPAAVQAHAYAQGSEIHLASGQEKHLPHELGHVVQQAQGRVQPTTSVGGMQVNDNPGLESEATAMGDKALQMVDKETVDKN